MPTRTDITTKDLPFLINAIRTKSKDLSMPQSALLIGAGCSYRSGIPLGGEVTELLQMQCFKRDSISDEKVPFKVESGFNFAKYKKLFEEYLVKEKLEGMYEDYIKAKTKILEKEVDVFTDKQIEAIIPPSLKDILIKATVPPSLKNVSFKDWFEQNKTVLYQDYAYGFWFNQYSESQRERSELLEILIQDRSTGYGYTCLANAISDDHIRNIFTTNFDDLLNDALSQYFFKKSRVIAHPELAEHINFHNHNPNIIKLHGDYLFADLKNTQAEISSNPLTDKMKEAFRDFGLIVLGYGGADYAIMNTLELAKNPTNPYKLIWCDMHKPEQLHWRVKHLLKTNPNSFYIEVQGFDVLMVQISEALGLTMPNIEEKAKERQSSFNQFYQEAKEAIEASDLPREEKQELDKKLSANEYFDKGYDARTPDEKIFFYTKAIERKPNYANAYNNRGLAWHDKNDYDKAIADYDKAIALKPDDPTTYYNRGISWNDKKEYDKAIADYDKAIELNPDYADVYNNRGVSWGKKKEYDKAIADYDKAIELKPDDAITYYNRGNSWGNKKEYDKAIADYDKAIELKPDYAIAYNNRGNSWDAKKEYDKAISDYDKAIELKPDDAEAYNNRGNSWDNKKEYDKAITDYDKAIELKPDDAITYYNRGNSWDNKKKYDKAIADYDKAIELNLDDAEAYNNRGNSWDDKKEYDKAIADYDKAIELNPDDAEAYNNRGVSWYNKKEHDKAIENYEKAIELKPDFAIAYDSLGSALISKGNQTQASNIWKQAIEKLLKAEEMEEGKGSYNLACAYSLLADSKEALKWFEKALIIKDDTREQIEADADFDNIRALPLYKELLDKYRPMIEK